NLAGIGLRAGRHDGGLSGPAAVEFALNHGGIHRDARRAAVDHDAYGAAVAFAVGGNAESCSEDGGHPRILRSILPACAGRRNLSPGTLSAANGKPPAWGRIGRRGRSWSGGWIRIGIS